MTPVEARVLSEQHTLRVQSTRGVSLQDVTVFGKDDCGMIHVVDKIHGTEQFSARVIGQSTGGLVTNDKQYVSLGDKETVIFSGVEYRGVKTQQKKKGK